MKYLVKTEYHNVEIVDEVYIDTYGNIADVDRGFTHFIVVIDEAVCPCCGSPTVEEHTVSCIVLKELE